MATFLQKSKSEPYIYAAHDKEELLSMTGISKEVEKSVEAVHASSFGLSNQRKSETMRKRRENDSKENAEILLGGFCLDAEEN